MARYPTNRSLDARPLMDGDSGFAGFASRRQSQLLEPGMLELSKNFRHDRFTARVREGLEPVATDIALTNPPVVLDFDLPTEYAITITRSGTTATATFSAGRPASTSPIWIVSAIASVYGADQSEYNGEVEITAINTSGSDIISFEYTVSGSPTTPATGTILTAVGPRIFDEYDDIVRASCQFATNDTARTEYVILAITGRAFAVRSGVASQEIAYPSGELIESTDEASMTYFNGHVFLFRGYRTAAEISISSITQSSGTATVTTASAHGYATNDWVFIQGVTPLGYHGIVQVTVTGATTFTYTVNSGLATPATLDGATVRACKRPLSWDGNFANDFVAVTTGANSTTSGTLIRMPPVPWAHDVGRRLALPYRADWILISDAGDTDTYDLVYTSFRLRYGSFDQIVAAVPAQNQVLFVLCRRSLHRLLLADLSIAAAEEITRDVGCAARRTIGSWGEQILWVSDRAVQRVATTGELSLLPERVPLSNDVQDIFEDEVDWVNIHRATARVWNNRYYLALPSATDAGLNTIVLIYNFINDRWETRDEYPAGFDVENWHIMDYAGEKRLFASTTFGFLYLLEENTVDTFGNTDAQQDYAITAAAYTRYYTAGTRQVKRVRRSFVHANVPAAAVITATIVTQNPDHTGDTVTIDEASTEDGRYPVYGGLPGSAAQLRLTATAGAEIRAIECEFSGTRERGDYNQT